MKSQWIRYAVVAVFASALGFLAHASISRAVQAQNAPLPAAATEGFSNLEARLAAQKAGEKPSGGKLQNNLLRKLWDMIDQADDLSSDEKSDARTILEEADPILSRIKKENLQAIEMVKRPPRRVGPTPEAAAGEKAPEEPAGEKAPSAEKPQPVPEGKK